MKKLHWKFMAFDEKKENGEIPFATEVIVLHELTEEEALKVAKKITNRKSYWLREAWECISCDLQERQAKGQERLIKRMEKLNGIEKKPWEKDDEE